jgi:uncharacterized protein (TIGR02679 family)
MGWTSIERPNARGSRDDMSGKMLEAVQYFQVKKGFQALFYLIRKKYESLGRIGGSIKLSNFSHEEMEGIALFMGESPHHLLRKGTLKLSDFESRLMQTRFNGISLHELLEAYFGEKILSKNALKEEKAMAQKNTLDLMKKMYPQIIPWFTYLESRSPDTLWIWRMLLDSGFEEDIRILNDAYVSLPSKVERYPLFSQRVTGNPHSLDLSTVRGKLWIHLLHVLSGGDGPPSQTELINDLLLSYNLLRDDIANFVTAANLIAYTEGVPHPVWKAAAESKTILNIPLRELLKTEDVLSAANSQKVYIVENSGVFSALMDTVPHAPLICTHGQFKLAGLRLMDLLVKSGHTLYYSGDFDPEGLSMALRFKDRYREKGNLWRMTVKDYQASLPIVELGERRGKLSQLHSSMLSELVLAIENKGEMGYQEGILLLLINDLQEELQNIYK